MSRRRDQMSYDLAWLEVVRRDLSEGKTPEEIGTAVCKKAEWYVGLAWLLEGIEGGEYELIREKHARPEQPS